MDLPRSAPGQTENPYPPPPVILQCRFAPKCTGANRKPSSSSFSTSSGCSHNVGLPQCALGQTRDPPPPPPPPPASTPPPPQSGYSRNVRLFFLHRAFSDSGMITEANDTGQKKSKTVRSDIPGIFIQ